MARIVLGFVVCLCVAAYVGCSKSQAKEEPAFLSLIQLVANPDSYHGRVVTVVGFVSLEPEGNAVYLHKADRENNLSKNAIWLFIEDTALTRERRSLSDGYVIVTGTFDATTKGHFNVASGTIWKITRLEEWPLARNKR